MIPSVDYVSVYTQAQLVGRLAMNEKRQAVFEYDAAWLEHGFSISPFELPLQAGLFTAKFDPFDGLFGVFNDSLPDGWGNLLIDRWLNEQGLYAHEIGWMQRLSIIGSSGMGALEYEPALEQSPQISAKTLAEYAKDVHKILQEQPVNNLSDWVQRAGSPAGARPKVLLHKDGADWLIKFNAPTDPPEMGRLEYDYAQAANASGILMPQTKLFDGAFFGIQRFDRSKSSRIHVVSAAGLLGASHRYPSLDYIDLMKATLYLTQSIKELEKVYRQMVFNVYCLNRDDHSKNFSFLYKNNSWMYAPAYDLVYSVGFNGQHSTTINGKGRPNTEDLIQAGVQVGVQKKRCQQILDEVATATEALRVQLKDRFKEAFTG